MIASFTRWLGALLMRAIVLAAMALASQTVAAAEAPLFAAPTPGHAAGPAGGGSLSQVTIALAVVLAFVFVAAWAMRHLRKLNLSGNAQQIQILSQVALGAKERAVLIRVNDLQVLVGVAPGQVTALHTFTAPMIADIAQSEAASNAAVAATSAAPLVATPTFQSLLKKSLGLR